MSKVERKCEWCEKPFTARTADVKRGWARFCSKSCKASHQEARRGSHRTIGGKRGNKRPTQQDRQDNGREHFDPLDYEDHDPSWDAHKDITFL